MLETFKKGFYLSLGMLLMSKEKVENLVNELVKKGEISQKEGEEFIKELSQKSEDMQEEFQKRLEEILIKGYQKLDLPTKNDFQQLLQSLKNIEKKLDELSQKISQV